jgi:hypothetical protein
MDAENERGEERGFTMRWTSACVVVCFCAAASAIAQERAVFSYHDAESRKGCFFHLAAKDWVELTGRGDRFSFEELARRDDSITLFDKGRGGVSVRLCADRSEWRTGEEAHSKWAPLWFGAWTTDVDLRPELKRWGLAPVRQGRRGTCSVFTTTSALEFAFSRYTGKSVRLSVEYLNWAANQAKGHATDGQFFHNCLAGFAKFGICCNADMPYAAKFDPKLAPSEKAMANAHELRATADKFIRLHWIKPLQPNAQMTEAQMHEIRAVLAIGWPVAAGASHSRLLVGYHDDPQQPGGGIFLTKDSGSGRYKRVTYEFVKSKVGDVFWVEALSTSR